MSKAETLVHCPKCGITLNEYERRHRSVLQWALFPNSRKYQCTHCGKKTFIFNFNTYLANGLASSADQDRVRDQQKVYETTAKRQTKTSNATSPGKARSLPDVHRSLTHPVQLPSPSKTDEDATNKKDTRLETTFISHINPYLNNLSASKSTLADNQQRGRTTTPEQRTELINPASIANTSRCQEIHALLNFPNPFVKYPTTNTVEDEIEEAKKIHLELQESLSWSMDNFQKTQCLKLGLIRESIRTLVESMLRNPDAIFLLSRLKDSDAFQYAHCVDASILAILFGRHMGLTKQELNTFALGVLLLDIGKSRLPNALLEKQKKLLPAEIILIQKHVQFSLDILKTTDIDEEILAIVENHHERFDGQGYPQCKPETDISVFTKMASIVDAYDAMTHHRPYRRALPVRTAIDILHQQRGTKFQAELVDEFSCSLGAYPTGSTVMLNTGQEGIVISQNEASRLQPKILVFRDSVKNRAITPFTQDLERESLVFCQANHFASA